MYKHKFFKPFLGILSSVALVSTISLSTVSCGHKSTTVNTWDAFKKAALAETAPNLKTTITNLKQYYWTNNDVAIFDIYNGLPAISSTDANTIVAIIIIKNKATQLQYPINFKIQYSSGSKYEVNNWTHSQTAGLSKWSDFKAKALSISAANLLAQAKNSKVLNTLKWDNNPTKETNSWTDNYIAEWDIYGGNGSGDSYVGMQGKPVANDRDFSITAIISIKDISKRGLYDANPIKAVIDDRDNNTYDISKWKFSPVTQSQSIAKYKAVVNNQITAAKQVVDPAIDPPTNAAWATFDNKNYSFFSPDKAYYNISDYLDKSDYSGSYSFAYVKAQTGATIDGGLNSTIILSFYDNDNHAHKDIYYVTLTNNFLFKTTTKDCGPAFSYAWIQSKPTQIPPQLS